VKITNSVYKDILNEGELPPTKSSYIGDPILSAIACVLTKTTGKPVTIEEIHQSHDGKIVEATFNVLETIGNKEKIGDLPDNIEFTQSQPSTLFLNLISLLSLTFGFFFVTWTFLLAWNATAIWGNDLIQMFLNYRVGEVFTFGIKMPLINYLLLGLALIVIGLIIFLQKKQTKNGEIKT
jgi:hypothetical protein